MTNRLPKIIAAIRFAADKHRDQRRKDKSATPYINHPIEVAELLVNEGHIDDESVIIAAILHDTVEDTETSLVEISNLFGPEIASIVGEVTDDKLLSKEDRKRKQVESASVASDAAKLVKLCDKICNIRDMQNHPPADWSIERRFEYFQWAKSVVDELRGINKSLEDLFDMYYQQGPDQIQPEEGIR